MDLSPNPNRTPLWPDAENRPKRSRFTWLVFGLALIIAFAALSASLTLFLGFAENDAAWPALLPAFILCFGVGAIAYVPAFVIAVYAWPRRRQRPRKAVLWMIALMILPWIMFSVVLVFNSPLNPVFGLAAGIISLLFMFWIATQFSARTPKTSDPNR